MIQRFPIAEGVTLSVIPSAKFKTNTLTVHFVVPLEKETAALTALVPKVLLRGSAAYPDMAAVARRLDTLYDTNLSPAYTKRSGTLLVGFAADFIKDRFLPEKVNLLEKAADVLFSILYDPLTEDGAFRKDYVEGEKADLISAIASRINNKAAYAKEKCTALMFDGLPYGLSELGTEEDCRNATAKAVYDRYLDMIHNAPMEISFLGETDIPMLIAYLKSRIPVSAARRTDYPAAKVLAGAPEGVRAVTEKMPVAQGKLVMGFRTGGIRLTDDNATAFTLFCDIFGGSPQSKLFMNVREKMSLCYYCRAMQELFAGCLFVSSGIETANRTAAYDAIMKELQDTKDGVFTDKDVEDAKRSLINDYKELDDNAYELIVWHLSRRIFGSAKTPEDVIAEIGRTTKEEIVAAGKHVALDTVFFIEGTGEDGNEEEGAEEA